MTECKNWVHWMATIKGARTVVLAAAIAGGMLCEALICEPAQAGTSQLAFSNTQNYPTNPDEFYAALELSNGSSTITLYTYTTNNFQGWVSNVAGVPPSLGGPNGINTSYTVGNTGTMLLADYFGFNLSQVPLSFGTVTSATLMVVSGVTTANLKLALVGATQYASQLVSPSPPLSAIYSELVYTGNTSYGTFSISENTSNPLAQLMFTLNEYAVNEINVQIQDRGLFVVSGSITDAPEPSTWVMMLAGFAGLGVLARRRAARRRAAAGAG
jgi:hypothetical protein